MLWYEDDIKRLETVHNAIPYEPETIFYGSSSIRQWSSLTEDFKEFKPVNLGFGGSTLAACAFFFDRVMDVYHPQRLVVYAGDNDLGDGRHAEEVFIFFQELADRATKHFGHLPCYFVSLKPSIARWGLANKFRYANELIAAEIKDNQANWHWVDIFTPMLNAEGKPNAELFLQDGLHLNPKGYQLWTTTIKNAFDGK